MPPLPYPPGSFPETAFEKTPTIRHGIPLRAQSTSAPSDPMAFNTNAQPNGTSAPRPRLLTVEEALQYSPLSSIVPFNSGAQCV